MAQNDNIIKALRKEFFAYRNGIIADKLRKAGDPHTMIMGCLLADLTAIARRASDAIGNDVTRAAVAQALWDDTLSRECRLTSPMIYPASAMTLDLALDWCSTLETVEIADNLCHKLLRHIHEAQPLCIKLITLDKPMVKYTGYRLMLNLLLLEKMQKCDSLKVAVEAEIPSASKPLIGVLNDILSEFD